MSFPRPQSSFAQMLLIKPTSIQIPSDMRTGPTTLKIVLKNPTKLPVAYTIKLNTLENPTCGFLNPKKSVEVSLKLSAHTIESVADAEMPKPVIIIRTAYSNDSFQDPADVLDKKAPDEVAYTEIPLNMTDEPGRFERGSTSRSPIKKQIIKPEDTNA